jgi:hypothetical protein
MGHEIKIVAAVLALIRGEVTASCVADSFGVTEIQVHSWMDIFQVAGIVALTKTLQSEPGSCEIVCEDENGIGEPTTTPGSTSHL